MLGARRMLDQTLTNVDTRDRVIVVEEQLRQIKTTVDTMESKVDTMHNILMRAEGAAWVSKRVGTVGYVVFGGGFGALLVAKGSAIIMALGSAFK